MSIASDFICVWIEEGVVYAGQKRIYDYDLEDNKGYIVKNYGYWYEEGTAKNDATLLAVQISQEANLPLKIEFKISVT